MQSATSIAAAITTTRLIEPNISFILLLSPSLLAENRLEYFPSSSFLFVFFFALPRQSCSFPFSLSLSLSRRLGDCYFREERKGDEEDRIHGETTAVRSRKMMKSSETADCTVMCVWACVCGRVCLYLLLTFVIESQHRTYFHCFHYSSHWNQMALDKVRKKTRFPAWKEHLSIESTNRHRSTDDEPAAE